MAPKTQYPKIRCFYPDMVIIAGRATTTGAGAIDTFVADGVATWAKSSEGVYLVTLDQAYDLLIAGVSTASGHNSDVTAEAVLASRTLTISTYLGSTDTLNDVDSGTINFVAHLRAVNAS